MLEAAAAVPEHEERAVFELGAAFKGHVAADGQTAFGKSGLVKEMEGVRRCVALFDRWSEEARRAVHCWLLVGRRRLGVVKDVRALVAKLLWEERAYWGLRVTA
jgi:hypothetical protein